MAGEGRTQPSTTSESARSQPDARGPYGKPIHAGNWRRERGRKVHGLVREADLKR